VTKQRKHNICDDVAHKVSCKLDGTEDAIGRSIVHEIRKVPNKAKVVDEKLMTDILRQNWGT
jgi:hypothetical protein